MIVQTCINGARSADFHPRLPLDAEAMAVSYTHLTLPTNREV